MYNKPIYIKIALKYRPEPFNFCDPYIHWEHKELTTFHDDFNDLLIMKWNYIIQCIYTESLLKFDLYTLKG